METKCLNCGRPLKSLGVTLDENEIEDILFITNKKNIADMSLQMDTLPIKEFSGDQIYDYMRAVLDNKAEAEFLYEMWNRNIRRKYNINPDISFEFQVDTIYTHGE